MLINDDDNVRWPQPRFFPTRIWTLFLRSQSPPFHTPCNNLRWYCITPGFWPHRISHTLSRWLQKINSILGQNQNKNLRGKDYYSICKLQILLSSVNSLYLLTISQRKNLTVTKMRKLSNKTVNIAYRNRTGQLIVYSQNQTWTGCLDLKSVSQIWQLQHFKQVHMPIKVCDIWLQGLVTHNFPKICNFPGTTRSNHMHLC